MTEKPPRLEPDDAVFLDFDGTLVDIVEHPDAVQLPAGLIPALERLQLTIGGALAIVSGRGLDDVAERMRGLHVALAGSHGMERRTVAGVLSRPGSDVIAAARGLADRLDAHCGGFDGILVERKAYSVALHYRGAPDREGECVNAVSQLVAELSGWEVVRGKMVAEARLAGISKASAVEAFMAETPFAGRRPVFIGDDVTDEDGFRAVQALGGFGVKVGEGASHARFRLKDPAAVLGYLRRMED